MLFGITPKDLAAHLTTKIKSLQKNSVTVGPVIMAPCPSDFSTGEAESIMSVLQEFANQGIFDVVCLPYYVGIPATLYLKRLLHDSVFVLSDYTILECTDPTIKNDLFDSIKKIHKSMDWDDIETVVIQGVITPFTNIDIKIPIHTSLISMFNPDYFTHGIIIETNDSVSYTVQDLLITSEAVRYWADYNECNVKVLPLRYKNNGDTYRRVYQDLVPMLSEQKTLFSSAVMTDLMGHGDTTKFNPLFITKREMSNNHVHKYPDMRDAATAVAGVNNIHVYKSDNSLNPDPNSIYLFMNTIKGNQYVQGIIMIPRYYNDRISLSVPFGYKCRNDDFLSYLYGLDFCEDPTAHLKENDPMFIRSCIAHHKRWENLNSIHQFAVSSQNPDWIRCLADVLVNISSMRGFEDQII